IDFDYLSVAAEHLKGHHLNSEQTKDFYLNKMFNQETVDLYSTSVKRMLDESVDSCRKYRDWMPIIDLLSKLMLLKDKGFEVDAFQIMYATVDTAFRTWIAQKYATLASSADVTQPVMLHHIPDYIRRTSQKPAIIVIDGMSFVDWQLIKEHFTDSSWKFTTTAVFSFLPSVTSIARQSLFSGAIPAQNKNPFSLSDEEKQWKSYWTEHGLREDEIFFDKSETPDIPYQSKVAGIVVNFIDTLMHRQLQGTRGMAVDIKEWLKMGSLQSLIEKLLKMGFNVFITSDHGHSEAIGKGRFSKPGLLTESASRRAVIYKDFAGAEELNKFSVNEYTGTYMLNNYRYFLFENGECIGDYGNKYITHGSDSIEELLVPFIRIGEI
ncbi:MAG: BREX-3 system phosphatase PglZ, partial [Eubacteriales bacterium]|nr:BREX-3 system phosphatase PglZ [Eubacteriales bacterium]